MRCRPHLLPWRVLDEGEECALLVCDDGCSTVVHREAARYGLMIDARHPIRTRVLG